MSRRDHGTSSPRVAQTDSNVFVNRRSAVQSCPPAPGSEKSEFTQVTALEAIEAYTFGRGSAETAARALAWQVRNPELARPVAPPPESHTEAFIARVRDLGLSDVSTQLLVTGLRDVARRVKSEELEPCDAVIETRTLAISVLRRELAS